MLTGNENRRVSKHHARNRKPQFQSTTQACASISEPCIVSIREISNEFMHQTCLASILGFFPSRFFWPPDYTRDTHCNVIMHSSMKQNGTLGYNSNM